MLISGVFSIANACRELSLNTPLENKIILYIIHCVYMVSKLTFSSVRI